MNPQFRNSPSDGVIELIDVTKIYRSYATPQHRLVELLSGGRRQYYRETRALDQLSFRLERGDRLGVVGENGSGKSTLLKVLAGVLEPTCGQVAVRGRVSALLELGAGFNTDLSGRENIVQFCMLHGMRRDESLAAVPEIIRFSELGDAVEHPVRTYSSGMGVRLGFACAVYVNPDILIVDEALSVGDAYFQNKCLAKIRSMLDEGTTFIYVTHSADSIRSLCNRGIWLERGQLRKAGDSASVGAAYEADVFRRMVRAGLKDPGEGGGEVSQHAASGDVESEQGSERGLPFSIDAHRQAAFRERVTDLRTGSGEVLIDDIVLVDSKGSEADAINVNECVAVRVVYHVESAPPEGSVITLGVTDRSGRQLMHFNSGIRGVVVTDASRHAPQVVEFSFKNGLCPGEFGLIAGVAKLQNHPQNGGQMVVEQVIDYCVGGARFSVRYPEHGEGMDLWGLVHVDFEATNLHVD